MKYVEMFSELHASDGLRQEVYEMITQDRTAQRTRKPTKLLLIAAIVAALLAGSAFAANLFGMRDLFAEQWQKETGRTISTDQLGLIDRLTQEVGVSDTDNGITITVDSAVRGEGILWLLLKIDGEGVTGACTDIYSDVTLEFSPEIEVGRAAWAFESAGVRENGSLMALLRYVPPLTGEDTLLGEHEVTLCMDDLYWNGALAAEGFWEMEFSLGKMQEVTALTLEKSVFARGISLEAPEAPVEVEYKNIRITPTEIWLNTDAPLGEELMVIGAWELLMEDGSTVGHAGGTTYNLPDGGMESVYYWRIPVELSEVSALKFGERQYPLK